MLERVELRVAWQKYRDRERAKAEALAEKERGTLYIIYYTNVHVCVYMTTHIHVQCTCNVTDY